MKKKRFKLRIPTRRGIVRFAENVIEILKTLRRRITLKATSGILRMNSVESWRAVGKNEEYISNANKITSNGSALN